MENKEVREYNDYSLFISFIYLYVAFGLIGDCIIIAFPGTQCSFKQETNSLCALISKENVFFYSLQKEAWEQQGENGRGTISSRREQVSHEQHITHLKVGCVRISRMLAEYTLETGNKVNLETIHISLYSGIVKEKEP